MSSFETIDKKRRHVRKYKLDVYPPKEIIEKVLWKAWKTTPSKNNFMPYNVFVLGPEQEEMKTRIWNKSLQNHQRAENDAKELGLIEKPQNMANPYYEHVKFNPYLLVFTCRVCPKPNEYYRKQILRGHFADQMYPEFVNRIYDTTCVEVGLFTAHLSLYCIEENIDVSYTSCFPRNVEKWADVPFVKYRPCLLMSMGYAQRYREQDLKDAGILHEDIKPESNEVIQWI